MKKILVIEDDPVSGKLMTEILAARGYRTHLATDGAEGLRAFDAHPPDMVLVDVQLPRKNGFEVAHEMRKRASSEDLPIVLMSAVLTDESIAKAQADRLGAQGYLIKPFKMGALVERVRDLIGEA